MSNSTVQILVFFFISLLIAFLTFIKCKKESRQSEGNITENSNKEYFLAGGGLSWVFIAGSITLTNLSTDQLVGMNGNQMALLAWWEFAAVFGLIILAKIFLPVYYNHKCTTTTELLEKRYNNIHIRGLIAALFLAANIFIFLPTVLYSGSLFMKTMFNLNIEILPMAIAFGIAGAAYAIFGGLRAVAISDTYSGILLLGMGLAVVYLSMMTINFDFSGIPKERLTLIGGNESPIPWHVLLTGMIFIQTFYWSTNQTITQRAMAAPTLREAQRGVYAAAVVRLLIVPPIIVIPGIVSYKLYGDIGDLAYGKIVGDVLPKWLSGAFAAAIAAAVLTTFNSILNSSAALYVCDLHEKYINAKPNVKTLNSIVTFLFVIIAIILVPVYAQTESIINTIQKLWGLFSMPILSTFVAGLLFKNVDARAAMTAVVFGTCLYGYFTFIWSPLHYIHMMFFTLMACILVALFTNKFIFGNKAQLIR